MNKYKIKEFFKVKKAIILFKIIDAVWLINFNYIFKEKHDIFTIINI